MKTKEFDLCENEISDITFSIQYMGNLMQNTDLIRNVAIVGHLHHGKTGLMDIFAKQTHPSRFNDLNKEYRYTDARKDE